MKPIKILSIDFDYFIDTDLDTRNNLFPEGADEIPLEELNTLWGEAYAKYPQLKDISVYHQFDVMLNGITSPKYKLGENVIAYPSHKDIYSTIISNFSKHSFLEVYNIDFHHDMYHLGGNTYNCSNWARLMLEEFPNATYKWYRRVDSEKQTLFGDVECYHSPFLIAELKHRWNDFDYIFICESPEWTPPHLHDDYLRLINKFK